MIKNIQDIFLPLSQGYQIGMDSASEGRGLKEGYSFSTRMAQIFQISVACQMLDQVINNLMPGTKLNSTVSSLCWVTPLAAYALKDNQTIPKLALIAKFIDNHSRHLALAARVIFVASAIFLIANGQPLFGGLALGMTILCYLENKGFLPKSLETVMTYGLNPVAQLLLFFCASIPKKIDLILKQILPVINRIGSARNPLIDEMDVDEESQLIHQVSEICMHMNTVGSPADVRGSFPVKINSEFFKIRAIPDFLIEDFSNRPPGEKLDAISQFIKWQAHFERTKNSALPLKIDENIVKLALPIFAVLQYQRNQVVKFGVDKVFNFFKIEGFNGFLRDFLRKTYGLPYKLENDPVIIKGFEKHAYWSIRFTLSILKKIFNTVMHNPDYAIGTVAKAIANRTLPHWFFMDWWNHWMDQQGWEKTDSKRIELSRALKEAQISLKLWHERCESEIQMFQLDIDYADLLYKDVSKEKFYPYIRQILLDLKILTKA